MSETVRKISRKDEARLPTFSSQTEARDYFVKKYGDNFFIVDSFVIDGERICYEFHLVLNWGAYTDGIRRLSEEHSISDNGEFLCSYQKIEVMDDGSVHVLH